MNSLCDGDRDSYDAMVLLTGRYDFGDMGQPGFTLVFEIGLTTIMPDSPTSGFGTTIVELKQ